MRRSAILDAAEAVFAEHGYNGATLEEIAERAEFGKGTLYNYFPGGKEELYEVLFEERVVGGLSAVVEAALPDARPLATPDEARAAFHDFVSGLLHHFEANRSVLRLYISEAPRAFNDPDRMTMMVRLFEGFMVTVTRAIARAMDAGALRPMPALPVTHLLIGNVRGLLMAHIASDCLPAGIHELPPLVPDETADFITTVLFDGLLARD